MKKSKEFCMFCIPLVNPLYWELFSIIALTIFGVLWTVAHARLSKYPMNILITIILAIAATGVIWARVQKRLMAEQYHAVIDVILLAAIACVAVEFVVVVARACAIKISDQACQMTLYVVAAISLLVGSGLIAFGKPEHLIQLEGLVTMLLQPAWLLVLVVIVARLPKNK